MAHARVVTKRKTKLVRFSRIRITLKEQKILVNNRPVYPDDFFVWQEQLTINESIYLSP